MLLELHIARGQVFANRPLHAWFETSILREVLAMTGREGLFKLALKSYVSIRGLANVLAEVKENPQLLEHCSRQTLKRSFEDAVRPDTSYGTLMKSVSIATEADPSKKIEFAYVDPLAWLAHISLTCEQFGSFFKSRLEKAEGGGGMGGRGGWTCAVNVHAQHTLKTISAHMIIHMHMHAHAHTHTLTHLCTHRHKHTHMHGHVRAHMAKRAGGWS